MTWPLPTTPISFLSQERHRTFFPSLKHPEPAPIPRPFLIHSVCSQCPRGLLPPHPSAPSSQLKQHPRHSLPSYLNLSSSQDLAMLGVALLTCLYIYCVSPHSPLHPLPQHTLAHILLRGNYSILFTAGSEVPAGLASPCS